MKTVGYVRVSTKLQSDKGGSVQNQRDKITNYCKLEGLKLEGIIEDLGISGTKKDRRGFLKLLDYSRTNQIDVVVVWSLSRLGRNLKDMLETINLFRTYGIELRCIKENIRKDDSISNLILNIMGSINQFEVQQLGERIAVVKQNRKTKGETYGKPQYGYMNVDGKILRDPKEYPIRQKIKRLRKKGYSWNSIEELFENEGIKSRKGKKFYSSTLCNIFKSVEVKIAA